MIISRHVIELERLAFPMGHNIASAPGSFVPGEDAPLATKDQSAALIEDHTADMLALGDDRFDFAVRTAPSNAPEYHVRKIEPVLFINSRAFQQPISRPQKFQFHCLC